MLSSLPFFPGTGNFTYEFILIMNFEGTIISANDAAYRFLNYHERDLIGKNITTLQFNEARLNFTQLAASLQHEWTRPVHLNLLSYDRRKVKSEVRFILAHFEQKEAIFCLGNATF